MYHEIAQRPETTSSLAVPPQAWAAQLAYLSAEGYQTLTAAELAAALAAGGELPARTVVLTFDDGYEDFHSRAMPLLTRYGFTATVFVTTGWVRDSGPLLAGWRPGRMLSWGQIEEAAGAGIEVAAHSCLHPQLDQLPAKQLRDELHASRARLEDRLGVTVAGVAYPFGYSNPRVRKVTRDVGYAYGCAVGNAMAAGEIRSLCAAAAHHPAVHRHDDVPGPCPGPEHPADLPQGTGNDQGLGHGPPYPRRAERRFARTSTAPRASSWPVTQFPGPVTGSPPDLIGQRSCT